jgi:glycosyltransferase involved in cell wall biosynthesis
MLKAWAKHMARLDVIVQSQDGTARIWQEGNFVVHYAPGYRGLFRNVWFLLWALKRLVRIHQQNSVEIVNGSDLLGGLSGILSRGWTGAKAVAQLQGEFINPPSFLYSRIRAWTIRALAIYICRHADMVRCLYHAAAEQVISLGVQRSRVMTIPSRCDTTLFDPERCTKRNKQTGINLLYVGSLVSRKGLNFLLSALRTVIQHFPSTTLTIVGDGSQKAGLEELVQALGLDHNVKFLGRIPHNELPSIMCCADLFVFPSLSEATPRAIMEAMAMEVPVVATRVGGIPEMVEDGATGVLVQPAAITELAEAIIWVLRHQEWAQRAGGLARQRVLERYTLEQHTEKMLALHQIVLSQ